MTVHHKKNLDYHRKISKYKKKSFNPLAFLFGFLKSIFITLYKLSKTDYSIALLLGAVHTLIFAPFNFLPAIFISFSGLLYLVSRCHTKSKAFKIGWFFGFGHFATSLHWIHNALLVDGEKFAQFVPVAVFILPAILAFLFSFVTFVSWHVRSSQLKRLIVFASAVTVTEIARTYFYLPFPWNLTAHSIAHYDYFLQFSFFVGAFGLTLLLSFTGGIFYLRSKKMTLGCISALILCMILGWGRVVIFQEDTKKDDYSIRLVQPYNLHHLNDNSKKINALKNLISLSQYQQPHDLKYIIWPESAYPFVFHERSENIKYLRQIVPKGGMLFFGADRIEIENGRNDVKIYNSLIGIDDLGDTLFSYDKAILVPFGEYIPFKSILGGFSKVVGDIYDFTAGQGTAIVNVHKLPPFTPFICYETIFPFWGDNESDFLIDITNNIWFGDSIGPHQHFAMVKFKAAETGKPMLRVANNGISAIVDKFGVVREKINLNDKSFIDVYISGGKFNVSFYFAKIFFLFMPFLLIFFVFYFEKKKKLL